MYLAKFFHRPPGDDDRELLLIPSDDPMIIGTRMHASIEIPTEDFLREQFAGIGNAVTAYRRHTAELLAAGYVETTHTRYTRRHLPGPEAKREWQKGLDDLMLAALSASLEEQARHLAALQATPAAREPLYLWLAAHHGFAAADSHEQIIRLAEAARDTLASRRADRTPHYAWSIAENDLEARIYEVLSWAHLRADNPAAALDAIEQACRIAPTKDRGVQRATILHDHFPDRQHEAFDVADKSAEIDRWEEDHRAARRALMRSWSRTSSPRVVPANAGTDHPWPQK
jgi:hypothetical protein